jgi:hypothetical protein
VRPEPECFGEHVDVAGPAAGDVVGGDVGEPQCFLDNWVPVTGPLRLPCGGNGCDGLRLCELDHAAVACARSQRLGALVDRVT